MKHKNMALFAVAYGSRRYTDRCFGVFLCLVLAVMISACSSNNKEYSKLNKAPAYIHPELHAIGDLPPYKIQIGDILEVKFLYNDEFDQEIIVRPDGVISTAAVQSVKAAGRTPEVVANDLTKEYEVHLKEPNLAVLVKSFAPTRISVIGEVETPGEYESLTPNPSLLQILARAGDIKSSAQSDQILIIRKNEVNQPIFYLASYDAAVEGRDVLADVQLTANDIVYVSRTAIADAHDAYQQYIRQFIPISIGMGYGL